MTQKTKLEIIGPYTPEHEGPFCTREGQSVRLLTKTDGSKKFPIVGYVDENNRPTCWRDNGYYLGRDETYETDLMNACEVSMTQELWVNKYINGVLIPYDNIESAERSAKGNDFIRTIHVREVMPGEE